MASQPRGRPPLPESVVFNMLNQAAERGDPCPSNDLICVALDASSPSRGSEVLHRLERKGLIKVERGTMSRVVTIVATGKRTAGTVADVHWRYRPENLHRRNIKYSRTRPPPPPAPKPVAVRVDRDPCPLCGIRGDIGCQHTVRW